MRRRLTLNVHRFNGRMFGALFTPSIRSFIRMRPTSKCKAYSARRLKIKLAPIKRIGASSGGCSVKVIVIDNGATCLAGCFEMDWRLETGLGRQGCRDRDVCLSSLGGLKELACSYLAKKHTTKTICCKIFSPITIYFVFTLIC